MKTKSYFYLIIIIIFYILINFIIENDNIKVFKDKIPNYLDWKSKFKFIFNPGLNSLDPILIKTDGIEAFELNQNDEIYIYTKIDKKRTIEIQGILENKIISCFKTTFSKDFKISLIKFSQKCKKAIYFSGSIDSFNKKIENYYFYFSLKKNRGINKNLIIFPTTIFYNYNSNINNLNVYTTKNIKYISNFSEIPLRNKKIKKVKDLNKSIHNIGSVFNNFDVVNDYNFENIDLQNYELIILPFHQEYYSQPFLEKLKQFTNSYHRNILSIGAANFSRKVNFEKNAIFFDNRNFYLHQLINDLGFYYDTDNPHRFDECKFEEDMDLDLGYLAVPLNSVDTTYFSYEVVCDNNLNFPLLAVKRFHVSGGKLIQILSDGVGIEFSRYIDLKSQILDLLK